MGLAMVVRNHAQALEYECMTRTGRTLGEYVDMGAPGMVALVSLVRYLPPESALRREMHPRDEMASWASTTKTNSILADLFDAFVAANTRKGRKAKPYPRPNARTQNVGSGAIPVRDFMDWWGSGA